MRRLLQLKCLPFASVFYLVMMSSFAQQTFIRAGRVVDPVSGTTSQNQIIVVEGRKIIDVGRNINIPANARVIDLSKSVVTPGLFDAHTHVCATVSKFADWLGVDYFDMVLLNPNGYRAIQGAVHAKEMLEAGFTTIRDAGNSGKYADVDVKRAINEGLIPGPTMVVAGKIIAPFGGQFRTRADKQFLYNDEYAFADSKDEIVKAIRENIYYGSDVIKVVVDGQRYSYSYEDLKTIVAEARNAGLKVMAHCQTPASEYAAAKAGVASIEHGWTIPDSVARVMKEKNVILVSTDFTEEVLLEFGHPAERAKAIHSRRVERLARAYKAGVMIAFGTDIMIDVENRTRGEFAIGYITSFVEAGIPNAQIVRALTTTPAILMGMEQQRGRVAKGMFADIIATEINPLDDINALKQVRFVMKEGSVIVNKN
ncbi:amidohydrolase family protein [Chryseolinea sp. T2]|uniref:amidohydrolase family protein n=1 Tax=Chryseolinea sp. T2 TaxID=3129255 RepID=UPI003077007B